RTPSEPAAAAAQERAAAQRPAAAVAVAQGRAPEPAAGVAAAVGAPGRRGAGAGPPAGAGAFGAARGQKQGAHLSAAPPPAPTFVLLCLVRPLRASPRSLVLEDLAGTQRDRVEPPPVLLTRILDVRAVDLPVGAVPVVAHREEAVPPGREVRVVGEPHVPT